MEGGRAQFIAGRKANSHIVHCGDGFHYNVRQVLRHRLRLRCRHYQPGPSGCRGTATVSRAGILTHLSAHNHFRDPWLQDDLEVRRAMIREARSNVWGTTARTILNNYKIRIGNPDLASRFTRVRMTSALYAAQSENYPIIPSTLQYLGVLLGAPNVRPICRTVDGSDYIFQGVIGNSSMGTVAVVFASGRMLQFLARTESVHGDGTFRKRPRKPSMMQIFNLVVKYGGFVLGVVRILMSRKTEIAYIEVLRYLAVIAPGFNPRRVHCDFERAEMNAFKVVFPLCRIVGCLWHYAVRISEFARRVGLAPYAEEHEFVFHCIRSLCAVPLLPMHLMWQGVVELWHEIDREGWGDKFLPLFQYFEREWKPRFHELSVFNDDDRTNNCSESDNRMLANAIPQNHPNIWKLIGGFVQLEHLSWCDKLAIDRLQPVAPGRRYSAIVNDRRVRMGSQMLVNGDIEPGHFLKQTSAAIHAATMHGLHMHHESDSEDSTSEDSTSEDSTSDDSLIE